MILVIYSLLCVFLIRSLGLKLSFSFASKSKNAHALVDFLIHYPAGMTQEVPQYKFYSFLIEKLIIYRNKFGCEISELIRDIRKSLVIDIKESRKLNEALIGGYYQYLMMVVFVWGFLFAAQSMIGVRISFIECSLLGSFHFIGLFLFKLCFSRFQKSYFTHFEAYINCFYTFKILLGASRPLSEVMQETKVEKLGESTKIKYLKNRLLLISSHIKSSGQLNLSEIDYCLIELWDFFELQFEKFNKALTFLKLALMFLFILPSYFFVLTLIMQRFNI